MRIFLRGGFSWPWAGAGVVAIVQRFGYASEVIRLELGSKTEVIVNSQL